MYKVLVIGAGKIGSMLALLLIESGRYNVTIADQVFGGADFKRLGNFQEQLSTVVMDVNNQSDLDRFLQSTPQDAVVSSLPFFCNLNVANVCRKHNVHYFDLTEDTEVTNAIKELSKDADSAFVPQCGLAPGYVGLVANEISKEFDELDAVKLRVGALPENSSNALQYALTWSIDGLINEYINPGYAIDRGEQVVLESLEHLRVLQIDGVKYEAFNTSGGLGGLAEIYAGKVRKMNYKTIRYPGHCDRMRFLLNDLQLRHDRQNLKNILSKVLPTTYQDMVLVYVSVTGHKDGQLFEKNHAKKHYPMRIAGLKWSAIQITTAASACSIIDLVLQDDEAKGFVYQEKYSLHEFLGNEFGQYLAK